MTNPDDPRYIIVFDRLSGAYIVVDTQTGDKLVRTQAANEADQICAKFNARHEAEQAQLAALNRASGRK